MKKLILAAFAVTCAVSVFAQGTVSFDMRSGTTTHIWGAPAGKTTSVALVGYGTNDSPAGTINYAAAGLIMIGGTGGLNPATTFAQLLGAPGLNVPEASLVPQDGVSTFRTGTAQGDVSLRTVTLTTIGKDLAGATFEVVAWDNSSGKYADWTAASVAWLAGNIAAGRGGTFNLISIGGDVNTPPSTVLPASFNLYTIPEPSTFALAGLGVAAMLVLRRRK